MGKSLRIGLIIVVLLFGLMFVSTSSLASTIDVGDFIKFTNGPGSSPGGEFGIKEKNGDSTYSDILFYTFCLEGEEYINYTNDFKVVGISDTVTSGDKLNYETAYLYTQFSLGVLKGFVFDGAAGEIVSATELQKAIWGFENEMGYSVVGGKLMYNSVIVDQNSLAAIWVIEAINAGWTDIGDVRVINIEQDANIKAQDQLILVPEPSTLLLLGVGLVGLGLLGRKKFKAR